MLSLEQLGITGVAVGAAFVSAAIQDFKHHRKTKALREALKEIRDRDPLDAMNHAMTFTADQMPENVTDPKWTRAVARAAERGTLAAARIAAKALHP